MMKVSYGRDEAPVVVEANGMEIEPVVEKKVDAREPLWEELEAKSIAFKKNMSKKKLEQLLGNSQ